MVRGRHGDPHLPVVEHQAVVGLLDLHSWRLFQIIVVVDAVADVEGQHGQGGLHEPLGADRAYDGQRGSRKPGYPPGGDQVVDVGDMVTVQVGEQQAVDHRWADACAGQAHQGSPTTVHQESPSVDQDQLGRAGPERIREGAARPDHDQFHGHCLLRRSWRSR